MTLKLTFITAVAGAALLLALPAAHAAVSPDIADKIALRSAPEQWQQALQVRSEALNRLHGARQNQSQGTVSTFEQALQARSEALNRKYGLGGTAQGTVSTFEQALQARSEALNRKYGLGNTAQENVWSSFERALQLRGEMARHGPPTESTSPVTCGSGQPA